jgi:hypothetical protein
MVLIGKLSCKTHVFLYEASLAVRPMCFCTDILSMKSSIFQDHDVLSSLFHGELEVSEMGLIQNASIG